MTRSARALFLLGVACLVGLGRGADLEVGTGDLPRIAPTEPEAALSTFQIRPGFRLELAACEPEVVDPVAVAFDEHGRLFAVEMRGYSERREERLGRIRMLEDLDGDGRYEKSGIFADDLPWPTGLAFWDGGLFVVASPDLIYFKDTDGDGRADLRKVVFTGFAEGISRLNMQALPNNLTWTLENRIHGATSFNGGVLRPPGRPAQDGLVLRGRDFSFDPRREDLRAESGGGQHGLTFAEDGEKFLCSNSRHLQQVLYEDRYPARNPFHPFPGPLVDIPIDGPAAEVFRISPDEPWRIVRTRWRIGGLVPGPVEGGGRVSGYFTSATGLIIYNGHAWPEAFHGDAFICDVGSNLVHRKKLRRRGLVMEAARPDDELDHEFLASTDNWFRPVQVANGPDGCLYVVDMYREVIEHPWSLPEPIKQHLDLNSGNDRGRIYRIVPDGLHRVPMPALAPMESHQLVELLAHPNGWHRETASRLLFQRQDRSVQPALERLARTSESVLGRLHALYALHGLGVLKPAMVSSALEDPAPVVRRHAVRLSEEVLVRESSFTRELWNKLRERQDDDDIRVRYQLALTLGQFDDDARVDVLARIATHDPNNAWIRLAVLSSLLGPTTPAKEDDSSVAFLRRLVASPALTAEAGGRTLIRQVAAVAGASGTKGNFQDLAGVLQERNDYVLWVEVLGGLEEGARRTGQKQAAWQAELPLATLVQATAGALDDPTRPESEKVAALQLQHWAPPAKAVPILLGSLSGKQHPPSLQKAAMECLASLPESSWLGSVLGRWPDWSEDQQAEWRRILLASTDRTLALLDAIQKGTIEMSLLSPGQWTALRGSKDKEVLRRVRQLVPDPVAEQVPARNWSEALALDGRSQDGRAIFLERCATCHRLGEVGSQLGPDLATVRAAGKDKILQSILDPNREVAPNYIQYDLQDRDGETYSGVIAGETATSLTLRQAGGVEMVFLRSSLAGMTSQGRSAMPENLVDDLTLQQMADLLAFVLNE